MENGVCEYAELLKALGHPVRLQILCDIVCGDCNVNGLVEKLSLPQSTVSQHLALLRNRGIITPHKDGVRTCYQITDQTVLKILQLLKEQKRKTESNRR